MESTVEWCCAVGLFVCLKKTAIKAIKTSHVMQETYSERKHDMCLCFLLA
jgi:hypothetical protein